MNITDQTPEVLQPSALEAISNAEINQSIATARRFPRQLSVVKQKMMSFATLDEATAASCFYTLPRGGKNIQGPSVRLAEIAVNCYQNLRIGTRIISTVTTGDSPHVVVQAIGMDMENNITICSELRRRIVGKKSRGGVIDEDDINLATQAASAIARRNVAFQIVPLALIKPVFEAARKVAIGDATTLVDRRAKCLEAFSKLGISKERVVARIEGKSVDDIGLEQIETLIGLFNAIKEGEVKIDEAFPPTASQVAAHFGSAPQPAAAPTQAATQQPAAAPQPAAKPADAPKPDDGDLGPQSAATATQKAQCRHCGAIVESISQHECQQMKEAIAGTVAQITKPVAASEPPEENALEALKGLCKATGITEATVFEFCKLNKLARADQASLAQLADSKLKKLCASWPAIVEELQRIQGAAAGK